MLNETSLFSDNSANYNSENFSNRLLDNSDNKGILIFNNF